MKIPTRYTNATDAEVSAPLWEFAPADRSEVIRERYRRGMVSDPEPVGDVEYV